MAITVKPGDIDVNGHVNNVVYVHWMQELAIAHWNALGGQDINRANAATWVARSHQIEYLRPAFLGDCIKATTWVHDVGKVRSTRKYAFHKADNDTLVARGETNWVFVRLRDGRPIAIPHSIQSLLDPPQT